MKETELNEVLNYMKQYVENKYEHDSEPMLTSKDLQLVLEEIEKLNNIINELEKWLVEAKDLTCGCGITIDYLYAYDNCLDKLQELKGSDKDD